MRTLYKNKVKMKYALQIAEIPEFEYYEDEDGNKYPVGVLPSGKTEVVYGTPVEFFASISMSGGEAEAVEYGLSTEAYSAIIITAKRSVPIVEGTLIWHKSEPELKHIEVEVNDVVLNGDYPIKTSADYICLKKSTSLNFDKYVLQAVNK